MSTQKPHPRSFAHSLVAAVLIFALSVDAQASDPCTTRANYDQAKAAADVADAAFKKLKEPDWSKLPNGYEAYIDPKVQDLLSLDLADRNQRIERVLEKLKNDLQKSKKAVGNLSLKQLQANLDAAKAKEKALKKQYDLKLTENSKLEAAIINLGTDIKAIEQNPDMPTDEKLQTISVLQEALQKRETEVKGLVSKPNEQIDLDLARFRVGNPAFVDFTGDEIAKAKQELGRAKEAGIAAETQDAQNKLDEAIEKARQQAKALLDARDQTAKYLRQYQPAIDLLEARDQKQRELEQTQKKQQDLVKQPPTVEGLTAANNKVFEAENNLEVFKSATKAIPTLEARIAAIQPWFDALGKRDQAQQKQEQAKQDYSNAIAAKDALLSREQNRFNQEQTRINQTRASLQNQVKDSLYYQKLSQMTLHARATYELILLNLVDLDCFGDLRNFMDDLKGRMKKLDEARDQILKEASAAAKAAAAKPVVVQGSFVQTGVVLGTIPGPFEDSESKIYGSISANSYSITHEYKPPTEVKSNVTHSWKGTPPATLKPGDIITLSCSSTATRSGKDKIWAKAFGGCGWQIEGRVEILKVARRIDSETEQGKVEEVNKGTFAGIDSQGVFHPSGAFSIRFKILPGAKGDTITIRAWNYTPFWGGNGDWIWNPAEYRYKFNP